MFISSMGLYVVNREKSRGFCDREVLNQRKWTQFSIYLAAEVMADIFKKIGKTRLGSGEERMASLTWRSS